MAERRSWFITRRCGGGICHRSRLVDEYPATQDWWGVDRLCRIFFNVVSLALLGFVNEGWMVYAILPLTALSAILPPALQGLISYRIADDAQGELLGTMTSVTALTLAVSPLLITQLFGHFTGPLAPVYLPGAPILLLP